MKKHLVAATALIAVTSGAASAADLGPRYTKAPMLAQAYSWTGFYIGGHVGGGWTSSDAAAISTPLIGLDPASLDQKGSGVIGGGQIGYNWQFAPNWVIGIEGDISGTGIRKSTTSPVTVGGAILGPGINNLAERNVDWLATVRGRFGYAADRFLVYVTGGGAWGDVNYTAGPNYAGLFNPVSFNKTQSGWTAGGGVEYAFTSNWTARAEYLYYDLGGVSAVNVSVVPPVASTTVWDRTRVNVVRAGVNYKF